MGWTTRWLRGLFGGKRASSYRDPADYPNPNPHPAKEKKRWGLVKSFREKDKVAASEEVNLPASYSVMDGEDEEEQNKRAITVAAATAAVAEAAIAAAQAAAVVVRLTSSGRVVGGGSGGGWKREESAAAVKIQAAFRGYLARRALRALKSLVKLQAIVRGNIVRKQAAETLRCMQALVRVQARARARACRALQSDRNKLKLGSRPHPGAPTPEEFEQPVRSNGRKTERSSALKRSTTSKQSGGNDEFRWLDQWMEDRYWDDEKNAKVLEIDTGKSNNYSRSPLMAAFNPFSRSFTTIPDSPSKDSTIAQHSFPSPSSVNMEVESMSPLKFPIVDGCNYGESPQFFSAASSRPFTPVKSECSRGLFSGYSDYPNYMVNTESSRAKVRSHSAPKQRPEFDKLGSTKGLTSRSGQRSLLHAKFTSKAYPGSGRLERLGSC